MWKASAVSVPGPANTHGTGALLGGYLIGLVKGERSDLHATIAEQFKWNTRAAIATTIGAAFTAGALAAKLFALS